MKILYIYDVKGWAIHKVGLLWLKNIGYEVEFKSIDHVTNKDLNKFDLVWYGFSYLYFKKPVNLNKAVISVHDPYELFAPHKHWKYTSVPLTLDFAAWSDFFKIVTLRHKTLNLLKRAKNVVTTSEEMKKILDKKGVYASVIKTTTDIPIINKNKIFAKDISVLSIANNHFRKNFPLLKKIKHFCKINDIPFKIKRGLDIYSRKDYIKLLDSYNVYVCTSIQEGGPLPAMDAMARGAVVLTTPVGQIQEIINGKNGFICKDFDDFKKNILLLRSNKKLLQNMRTDSLGSIKKRSSESIKKSVINYLKNLIY